MATQDEINQFVETIMPFFEQAPPPDDADEVSFPVVNQAVTADMWSQITEPFGSGVIDRGQYPYRMANVSDSSDTVTIGVNQDGRPNEAILNGYFHRQTNPIVLSVPPVSSQTAYTIALQYDPLRTGKPIELGVFSGALNRSQGKKYIRLWSGTRRPSTVLSSVTWYEHRQRIRPTIRIDSAESLVELDGLLWGTEARVTSTNDLWRLSGTPGNMTWQNITAPDWQDMWIHPARVYPGFGWRPRFRRFSDRVEYRGVFRRSDNSAFRAGESFTLGTATGGVTFPETTRWAGGTGLGGGEILVEPNGDVRVTPGRDVWNVAIDGLVAWTK